MRLCLSEPVDRMKVFRKNSGGGQQEAPLKEATVRDLGARLRSIAGHVRGVERMVSADKSCASILEQVFAVQCALDKVARILVDARVEDCLDLAGAGAAREAFESAVQGLAEMYEAGGVGRR